MSVSIAGIPPTYSSVPRGSGITELSVCPAWSPGGGKFTVGLDVLPECHCGKGSSWFWGES